MIVRSRPTLASLFFVLKGSIVQRIWPQIVTVGVMSILVVAAHRFAPNWVPGVDSAPFTLIGISLSIFLSFRNSACYDRWWEGRKLWGEIIHTSYDIARQTIPLDGGSAEVSPERRSILNTIISFARIVARQKPKELGETGESPLDLINPADGKLLVVSAKIARYLRDGRIEPVEAHVLNESLVRLSQALVGCQRLANTPLPFAYTLLLHRTAYIFCFILPFGFADSLGWGTPLAVMLIAYTFFGLDALGEELEDPFGSWPNALPIESFATMIEINLKTAMGQTDLPAMPTPKNHILS